MQRRRGAFCADDAEEYIKLAIDNEFKISPFYDGLKTQNQQKITFTDFDFTPLTSPIQEEDIEAISESKFKLLVIDTHKGLKSQIQAFCGQSTKDNNAYITDFYSKEIEDGKLHFWLQNQRNPSYQTLKDCYLSNFQYFLIVETRRSRKIVEDIIERINNHNKNAKVIFKIKVSPLVERTFTRQQANVTKINCVNLLEGLAQVQLMIQS